MDEINAKGGVLGRKLEMVVADETENPETGISAIKKLTADEKVDVLIGGYTSGVTLAQLPHISRAPRRSISASARPRRPSPPGSSRTTTTTSTSSASVRRTPPTRRGGSTDFISGFVMGELGYQKIAIIGENAKWVQDLVPAAEEGRRRVPAPTCAWRSSSTRRRPTSRRCCRRSRTAGAQYLVVILSHALRATSSSSSGTTRASRCPIGGIDVKSMDADFFQRVGGKSIARDGRKLRRCVPASRPRPSLTATSS